MEYSGSVPKMSGELMAQMNTMDVPHFFSDSFQKEFSCFYHKYAPIFEINSSIIEHKDKLFVPDMEDIFKLIKIGLSTRYNNLELKIDSLKTLSIFLKTPDALNKMDDILLFIKIGLEDSYAVKLAALQALEIFIKATPTFNKTNDILSIIELSVDHRHSSDSMKEAVTLKILKVLDALIKTDTAFIAFNKSGKIFNLIREYLSYDSIAVKEAVQHTLLPFIKTLVAAKKTNEILDFIQENLNHGSDKLKIATLQALEMFIKIPVSFDKTEKILDLVKKALSHASVLIQDAALNALIKMPATFKEREEIFDLIKKQLGHASVFIQTMGLKNLTAFIEVTAENDVTLNGKSDEILSFIIEKLTSDNIDEPNSLLNNNPDDLGTDNFSTSLQSTVLQALKAFIKTPAASHKMDEIFNFIMKNLENHSGWVQQTVWQALEIFSTAPTASNNANKIVNFITKNFDSIIDDRIQVTAMQIVNAIINMRANTSIASNETNKRLDFLDNSENVFCFIKKRLGIGLEALEVAGSEILINFIKILAESNRNDETFDFIKKSLESALADLQILGLEGLKYFIKMPEAINKADEIFKLIKENVDKNLGRTERATFQALTVFLETMTIPNSFSNEKDEVFISLTKTSHTSVKEIEIARLQAITACIKYETALTPSQWEARLTKIWEIVKNNSGSENVNLRRETLSTLTALIKHCPRAVIEKTELTAYKEISLFLCALSSSVPDKKHEMPLKQESETSNQLMKIS